LALSTFRIFGRAGKGCLRGVGARWFLALGCGPGKFSAADGQVTKQMQMRAIPLSVIEEAMLLGVSRKYSSWLNGGALEPIRSIRYFEPLISPPREYPEYTPPGYYALFFKDLEGIKYEIVCHAHSGA
jgi:hypothetical protein